MDDWTELRNKPNATVTEVPLTAGSGMLNLIVSLLGLILCAAMFIAGAAEKQPVLIVGGILGAIACVFVLSGLFVVNPNEAKVLQLFGSYKGSVRDAGIKWANPFYSKRSVTLRVRNFESEKLKVNDHAGNPIEIAAVVVWRVVDSAEALFQVDNYDHFVRIQSEAALRNLAMAYPYDGHVDGEVALRSHPTETSEHLKSEIQERLAKAGVEVLEARISLLAYAPEIAHAMLQRQQASAVIAARQKIVEGAVGMVEMALTMLSTQNIVELDNERKAAMVSNLLVVLCSDRGTQPVISTASTQAHGH
jgi:regulator of protease activity HflC (stomatin/prohibitin superfamily)